jgi:non-specific serine/threonine protein kinase
MRIKALNGLGLLAYAQSELAAAKDMLTNALTLARSIGDPAGAGWSLHALGRVAIEEHDLEMASDLLDEAIRTSVLAGDDRAAAYSRFFLAGARCQQGDAKTAEQLLIQAEEPLRAIGDLWGLATLTMVYAGPALARGDLAGAARRYGEGLTLLAEGRSNREIADALSLSVRTVENHLAHLYGKLGVRSRVEAALYVVRDRPDATGRSA